MNPIGIVGWSAVGLLVVLWLVVSFSEPGRRREVLEWLAATSLFVALSMLFLNLVLRSRETDNTLGLVAFGFLLLVFSSGGVVSLVNVFRALGESGGKSQASTTN